MKLFNLPILNQGLLAVDGGMWAKTRQSCSLIVPYKRHCIVFLHLLGAGEDRNHMTCLRSLLLARAGTAARPNRGASLVDSAPTTLKSIRVITVVGSFAS